MVPLLVVFGDVLVDLLSKSVPLLPDSFGGEKGRGLVEAWVFDLTFGELVSGFRHLSVDASVKVFDEDCRVFLFGFSFGFADSELDCVDCLLR